MTNYSGTVYPNGEFTIGVVPRRLKPMDILPVKAEPSEEEQLRSYALHEHGLEPALAVCGGEASLGSTSLPISHKRSPKGLKGMTSYGRRMLRNGCYLLEQQFGRGRCGFATLTLPELTLPDWAAVCANWGDIVRKFIQKLKRRLTASQVKPYITYVTEFQNKRYEKTGRPYPHIHICYPARPRNSYQWYLSASEFRDYWKQVVQSCCASSYCFDIAVDCVVVKKSVGAYLSKYLSKGAGDLERYLEAGLPIGCLGHWWGLTGELRRAIKAGSRTSPDVSRHLWRQIPVLAQEGRIRWCYYISIETRLAGERIIGVCGQLDCQSTKEILSMYPRGRPK